VICTSRCPERSLIKNSKAISSEITSTPTYNLPGGSTHYLKIPPAHKLALPPHPHKKTDMQWGKRTRTLKGIDGVGDLAVPPFLPFRVSDIWQTIMRLSFITNARQLNKLLDGATLQAIITTFHMHPGNTPPALTHGVTGESGSTGNLYPFSLQLGGIILK